MATYRVRPSKPMAIFGTVVGVAILVFGVVTFVHAKHFSAFMVLWVVIGLGIIGFNLWSAFSRHGGTTMISSDSGPGPSER